MPNLEKVLDLVNKHGFFMQYFPDTLDRLALVDDYMPSNKKGKLILDAGCGTGLFTCLLENRGYQVVGVDVSRSDLNFAHSRLSSDLVRCDIKLLCFRNRIFDEILCTEVLEHIPQDQVVLHEFSIALKKHGRLVLTVPCSDSKFLKVVMNFLEPIYEWTAQKARIKLGGYHKSYSSSELKAQLRRERFKINSTQYFHRFLVTVTSAVVLIMINLLRMGEPKFRTSTFFTDIKKVGGSKLMRVISALSKLLARLIWIEKTIIITGNGIIIVARK